MAKGLDIEAKNNLDAFYAQNRDATEALIKNAVLNLKDDNTRDYFANEYFTNNDEYAANNMINSEELGPVYENPDFDDNFSDVAGDVTKSESQDIMDFNDYSSPGYLDKVAGQVITMPNGEVRTYSENGHSYSIPAESWMGVGDSTYQITTHNKLSGAPMKPSKQYIGISDEQARPFYMLASTGVPGKVTTAASRGLNLVRGGAKIDAGIQVDKAAGSPIMNYIMSKLGGE